MPMNVADQSPDVAFLRPRVPHPQTFHFLHKLLHKLIIDAALDEDARGAKADLALVGEAGTNGGRDALVQIGVVQDDPGVLPERAGKGRGKKRYLSTFFQVSFSFIQILNRFIFFFLVVLCTRRARGRAS